MTIFPRCAIVFGVDRFSPAVADRRQPLHLNGANHWNLEGFTVENSAKGIVLDRSSNNVIDDVEVRNTRDEGVHFRATSSDNVIQRSFVHDTGTEQP
ncbi:right-handed parallel beta-helix repeat-containing protein [Saccharopolyspora sp. NPDC050642]|uniref:right-handed parallel beta-helix repeat-containing protein n=1 Tax=Saccharopolyspora sp. NPDC050642 TaxID=3157099 RepID=UPI0033D72528